MNILTYPETLTSEIFMNQSDDQLKFTLKSIMNDTAAFNVVEYILTSQENLAFVVNRDFYINSLLNELGYRNIL